MKAKDLPLPGETFTIEGHTAFLIRPPGVATASHPWVWYAPSLPDYPEERERWMFERFLAAGIAVAGIDVGESYGNPTGRRLFTLLYDELTGVRGLSKRPCLLARSRGGLMHYNWAVEHPQAVSGIAGIYPVTDMRTFPGLDIAADAYGLSLAQLEASLAGHNPNERVGPLAAMKVPIFHIHGDLDEAVPLQANSAEFAQRYRALGGPIQLEIAAGQGHNYWQGFFRSQRLVDFVIEQATKPGTEG